MLQTLPYTGVFSLLLEHRLITPLHHAGRHRLQAGRTLVTDSGPELLTAPQEF